MTLSYDGHDLESLFICGEPELSILNAKPDFANTTARNGNAFIGMRYGESTVAFTIVATGTAAERRGKFSTLGSWLMVDAPGTTSQFRKERSTCIAASTASTPCSRSR